MNIKFRKFMLALTLTFVGVSLSACAFADAGGKLAPLVIQEQGQFCSRRIGDHEPRHVRSCQNVS